MKWHIGCSGFHYAEWKDVFYPPKLPRKKWFDHYSAVFNTLELNVTFYRFPQPAFLKNWYDISPDQFSFSVKAPRLITHFKQFKDVQGYLSDFYGTSREGLGTKLGNILFQLPPKFDFTEERLERIIENMDPSFNNVIEFRHSSWWNMGVYNRLKAAGIIFCGISHPSLPDEPVVNNPVAYYRFHGVPVLYYSAYENDTLKIVADELRQQNDLKEVFIYFNNTAGMAAIHNAQWVKEYLGITEK